MLMKCVNIAIAGIGGEWGTRPFTGLGCGNVCISILSAMADFGVVSIFSRGIGNVHRLVAWSFAPAKITVPLYHTSHFSLSKMTLHLALHKSRIPIREAIFNDGTMCPVNFCGSHGILMSQTCVNHIVVLSGKFILSGLVVIRLLPISTLSMMNISVAPVSAMALFVAMVSAFKYCGMGVPNMVSSSWTTLTLANTFKMGSKDITFAETK